MFVAAAEHNPTTWRKSAYAGGRIYRSEDRGKHWQRLAGGLPENFKHEFGALCLEEWGNGYSVFGATTGGEVYCGEANGERWTLIASNLAPVSKKGHERLLAAS
jgi:phage pi2 protein 07